MNTQAPWIIVVKSQDAQKVDFNHTVQVLSQLQTLENEVMSHTNSAESKSSQTNSIAGRSRFKVIPGL